MEAKGGVVASVPKFVLETFGDEAYEKWLAAISPNARELFSGNVVASAWYPVGEMLVEPTQKICELFYQGDMKGAWESGRFSAEVGLKGIYRIFVAIGTPYYIIKKAAIILPTFYKPSAIEVADMGDKVVTLHITEFPEPSPVLDNRIAGWIERALEICGCKEVVVSMPKLASKGDPFSIYRMSWS